MRRLLCWIMAVGATAALHLALSGSAQAMTCSERLQVCHGYSVKSMGRAPGCHAKCRQFSQECMASGCWESAKQSWFHAAERRQAIDAPFFSHRSQAR